MQTKSSSSSSFNASELIQNLTAGLTVSFVAISLGAAFGILSGRGAFAGILSAGVIACITALFGGTRIQCSGPTGPMTAVTVLLVAYAFEPGNQFEDPDRFINLVLVLTGGGMGLAALLRLGRFIMLVPRTVISGFMNGIAVLMGVELVLNGANVNFVAFSRHTSLGLDGQIVSLFVIVLAAAEAAVALAIALNFYNTYQTIDVDRGDKLQG